MQAQPGHMPTTHGKPLAFTLKSLIEAETQYANIKWELLAVVYTYEHFHKYFYCCTFTVEMDNKPLEIIL